MRGKKIFIINGLPRAGKDTFIDFCCEFCRGKKYSIIDPIKEIVAMINIDATKKTEKDRKLLSDLKIALTTYNDYCVLRVKKVIDDFLKDDKIDVLFLTLREQKDIVRIKEYANVEMIFVTGDRGLTITSNEGDGDVKVDPSAIIIENKGDLSQLRDKAYNFTQKYIMPCCGCNKKETDVECLKCPFKEMEGDIYCNKT